MLLDGMKSLKQMETKMKTCDERVSAPIDYSRIFFFLFRWNCWISLICKIELNWNDANFARLECQSTKLNRHSVECQWYGARWHYDIPAKCTSNYIMSINVVYQWGINIVFTRVMIMTEFVELSHKHILSTSCAQFDALQQLAQWLWGKKSNGQLHKMPFERDLTWLGCYGFFTFLMRHTHDPANKLADSYGRRPKIECMTFICARICNEL